MGNTIKINPQSLRNSVVPAANSAKKSLASARNTLSSIIIPSDFTEGGTIKNACNTISSIEAQLNTACSNVDAIVSDYSKANAKVDEAVSDFERLMYGILGLTGSSVKRKMKSEQTDKKTVPITTATFGGNLNYEIDLKQARENQTRTGASIANLFMAFGFGVDSAIEETTDGIVTLIAPILSEDMRKEAMTYVATEHVENEKKNFYENNEYGRWLDTNAYDPFKSTGAVYQTAEGIGNVTGKVLISRVTGVPLPVAAGIGGMGRASEEYWVNARDNANGKEWKTTDTFTKGWLSGAANGVWEGVQWGVGAKITGMSIPGANLLQNAAARVTLDSVSNAADTPYRAAVASLINGTSFKEEFDNRGGWNAVARDAFMGAIGSAGGEVVNYKHNRNTIIKACGLIEQNRVPEAFSLLSRRRSRGMFDNITNKEYDILSSQGIFKNADLEVALEFLSLGSGRYGFEQGIFQNLENIDPVYFNQLRNKLVHDYKMSPGDATKLLNSIDLTGVCSYANFNNIIFDWGRKNPVEYVKKFGMPLYRTYENGRMGINDAEQLLDLYYFINHFDNGGEIIRSNSEGNFIPKYSPRTGEKLTYKNLGEYQQFLDDWEPLNDKREKRLNNYLSSKSSGLSVNIKYINGVNSNITWDDMSYISGQVDKTLNEGKQVSLTISNIGETKFERCVDGRPRCMPPGAHIVTVVKSTKDGFVVDTWGERCLIRYSELMKDGMEFKTNTYTLSRGK